MTRETWIRASRCRNSHCVEVVHLPDGRVAVRDSQRPMSVGIVFGPEAWAAFLDGIRASAFDRPSADARNEP